mmetsp:Transcript_32237/g.108564  ORF Transcript_32237/g.108564 Transcript_32237/m.108564 type:complete len:234 (-) Transcript_32237:51-752(-)
MGARCVALTQLRVARELEDVQPQRPQPLRELLHHLLCQRLQRRHVDGLVLRQRLTQRAQVRRVMPPYELEDAEQRHVRLARARRRADEQILLRPVGHVEDGRLHAVQRLRRRREASRRPRLEALAYHLELAGPRRRQRPRRRHDHLLVAIVVLDGGAAAERRLAVVLALGAAEELFCVRRRGGRVVTEAQKALLCQVVGVGAVGCQKHRRLVLLSPYRIERPLLLEAELFVLF